MKFLMSLLVFLSSCASVNNLSSDPFIEARKVCLDSEGRGRLTVQSSTYIFKYYSELDQKYGKWSLGLDFPMQEEEVFELDWSENGKMKFTTSIDNKILNENSKIDPKELDRFTKYMGYFLKDLMHLKNGKEKQLKFKWHTTRKKLTGENRNKRAVIDFENVDSAGYFGLMSIEYRGRKSQNYKMEFVLSKCFLEEAKT